MAHLPYRRPRHWSTRRTDRLLVAAALGLTVVLGPLTVASYHPPTLVVAAPAPTWGPGGSAFGTLPSSGDSVVDCGEMADHDRDLSTEATEVLERCLDLHGWTYTED